MKKRFSVILLSLVLVLWLLPGMSLTEMAAQETIKYLDDKGAEQTCAIYTPVTSSTSFSGGGWYVVNQDVTLSGKTSMAGDIHLILCDGKTLTVTGRIEGTGSITIYAQSTGDGMGYLHCEPGNSDNVISSAGNITINGGRITAWKGIYNGIAANGPDSSITINGGSVNVTGGTKGIYAGKDIVIKGGSVKAEAQAGSAIYADKNITIDGGEVEALNGFCGLNAQNAITISDGTVTARSGTGLRASNGVTIEGGTVRATDYEQDSSGYGIHNQSGNITVKGGAVTAEGHTGLFAEAGDLVVSGGTILATGREDGMTIHGKVTISGGSVTAEGGRNMGVIADSGLEISSGDVTVKGRGDGIHVSDGSVTISGGDVTARAQDGTGVAARRITITGGKVKAETNGSKGMDSPDDVTIKGGELIAAGKEKGINGTVRNAITGTGWTDMEGTTGKTVITISADGQALDFKKVQFPGEPLPPVPPPSPVPPAEVTTKPTAKVLTYTGSAQELVTAGTASGGSMQYALGTNADTKPDESAFAGKIPSRTESGIYFVWYRVKGDANHTDTEPVCITVSIEKLIPPTGDSGDPGLWLGLALLGLVGILLLTGGRSLRKVR